MSFNTNRQARLLRQHLGHPKQYTHSPWQWGYVQAVHAARTTTLSSAAAAGALVIQTAATVEANALIVVGSGGPVQVQSVSGTGPFTLTLANRGVPIAQSGGATVRVIATVDLYLDGWQNPPDNLPIGVTPTLTVGVRYLGSYAPLPGQVVLIGRGTGLQRSDRIVLGSPAVGPARGQIIAFQNIRTPNYVATPATYTCIDSVKAVLRFNAPGSGSVLLTASSLWNNGTAGARITLGWSNGTTNNAGLFASPVGLGDVDNSLFILAEQCVTGLTPGAAYTVALQWAYYNTAGAVSCGQGSTDLNLKAISL